MVWPSVTKSVGLALWELSAKLLVAATDPDRRAASLAKREMRLVEESTIHKSVPLVVIPCGDLIPVVCHEPRIASVVES